MALHAAPTRRLDPLLRDSYALCRRLHATHRPTYLAARLLLPPAIRPQVHAVVAFFAASDRVADVGDPRMRERAFRHWSAAAVSELRRGESRHPLRRALIDTTRRHGLEPELFIRFLEATRADSRGAAEFATFDDLRVFLRGVSGTAALVGARLLCTPSPELDRLASLIGEVHQLIDIFCDFAEDLPQGRVYLPAEDMERCEVDRATVRRGVVGPELDALVRLQVSRARELHLESTRITSLVPARFQPFARAALEIHRRYLDVVDHLGSRVLREGASLSKARLLRLALPHVLGGRLAGGTRRAGPGGHRPLGVSTWPAALQRGDRARPAVDVDLFEDHRSRPSGRGGRRFRS
ncbi:phytoene/squalene synthase family protein [Actinoalloteichus hymeniacidonis]|uniref:Phytoene/squalene synthetase n=1 Tax=Actinoalloteichus hymeniacidonis TaxID=340345 RepID=A0AAC9MY03_9PSEU|nr:squalene/phytoene synthase family protein [Actinoalloteichus hymeniacidonis]AOS63883.1 phytoene/squalene synthetase [Actinoalloteichus hymeniacidonis]MBB5908061.1 phytoene synthase [Actinoalloteichus hymeniacidonis]